MAAIETKAKKLNFFHTEIEVLVIEVDKRQVILFGSHSSGITGKKKKLNQPTGWFQTLKKVVQLKGGYKKSLTCHRKSVSATGGAPCAPDLSPLKTWLQS